jgi:excisionase family DNA binding protein
MRTYTTKTEVVLPSRGLRLAEAANYMGVTIWFVRVAIWSKKLRAHKFGKRLIVLREDCDAFLDLQKIGLV